MLGNDFDMDKLIDLQVKSGDEYIALRKTAELSKLIEPTAETLLTTYQLSNIMSSKGNSAQATFEQGINNLVDSVLKGLKELNSSTSSKTQTP